MTVDRPHWTDQVFSETENFEQGTFTLAQKRWLDIAWRDFCGGPIPDVFAIHAKKCGEEISVWALRPDQKYHWHHITPGRDATAHNEISELPENAIPLPAKRHLGPGADAIHPDVSDALSSWGYHKQGLIPDPFTDLAPDHAKAAAQGLTYWDTSYDEFFRQLAERVVTAYKQKYPDRPWPVRIHKSSPRPG